MITCSYCDRYRSLKSQMKKDENEKKAFFRQCPFAPKTIEIGADSPICENFIPADKFFCDKFDHMISAAICKNRVQNKKNLDQWKYCQKCRQYEQTIFLLLPPEQKSRFTRRK